jgi:hypothetical protein
MSMRSLMTWHPSLQYEIAVKYSLLKSGGATALVLRMVCLTRK